MSTPNYAALAASAGTGESVRAAVQAPRAIGSSIITVNLTTHWPIGTFIATTGTLLSTGKLDPTTVQVFYGTASGTTITITSFAAGYTDKGNTIGDVVVLKPTTEWANVVADSMAYAVGLATQTAGGWQALNATPNSVTANGNRSYTLTFNGTDLTGTVSAGMRLKTTRTVAAPTQCTSLNGTTQYYSKSSPANMAQTDKITESIWIKPDQYKTAGMISRNNGTTDGWKFYLNSSGQIVLQGARAGDDVVTSYQSVALNKWTHVSASIDTTTTTGVIEIDGVTVPSTYTNNANTGFAAPTTAYLIGATNSASPTDFFSGKIAQAASFNVVITVATLLTYLSQGYSGTETALISAYSFNNSINDLNANANNLTANGSAVATNADSPFGGQADGTISSTLDYAEIISASFSTNTTLVVRTPGVNTIPTTGGVSAVSYSTQNSPYGWPGISNILVGIILCIDSTATAADTVVNGASISYTPPINRRIRVKVVAYKMASSNSATNSFVKIWDGTVGAGTAVAESDLTSGGANYAGGVYAENSFIPSSGVKNYNLGLTNNGGGTSTLSAKTTAPLLFTMELA